MGETDKLTLATCSIVMRFAPGDAHPAVELLRSVTGLIQAKRGCHACKIETEAAEPGLVHYREEWGSEEAFRRHVRSEEFQPVLVAMDMCSEAPQIVVGKLDGHGGMAYLRTLRGNAEEAL